MNAQLKAAKAVLKNLHTLDRQEVLLALGYIYSDPESALNILQKAIHQSDWGLPFHGAILLHWYESHPDEKEAKKYLRSSYTSIVAKHRIWYEQCDPSGLGLPCQVLSPHPKIDPLFLTALCWSNESLIQIGHTIGEDVLEVIQWHELTIFSMNEDLWDEGCGGYCARKLENGQSIKGLRFDSFVPLAAEIPTQDQAEIMLQKLEQHLSSGDIQIFEAWLLYHGLQRYDFEDTAARLRQGVLAFCAEYGFCEGFDLKTGEPSASPKIQSPLIAALITDFIYS